MAKARRRSITPPRRVIPQGVTLPGSPSEPPSADRLSTGRGWEPASKRHGLLPRSASLDTLQLLRELRSNREARALREPALPARQTVFTLSPAERIRRAMRTVRMYSAPPSLAKPSSPCRIRHQRQEVMFALGVAGRRWGRGGPSMRHARRTYLSSYSCKR